MKGATSETAGSSWIGSTDCGQYLSNRSQRSPPEDKMVNVLSLPDDLLGRLAYPEGGMIFNGG